MKPSKTTNRLHFEDLDPKRFEDLCLNLIYKMKNWKDIKHYGATGKDEGIDIYTVEQNNGNEINWIIQCKRYKSINKTQLTDIIDKIIKNNIPDVLLLIISCDVSKANQDYFDVYSKEKGIKQNIIWTQSILEAKLYSDHNDLLSIYFNIDNRKIINDNIQIISKRIKMRDYFKKELYNKFDPKKPVIGFHRFNCSKIIIQKPDYSYEQENIPDEYGWYKSFTGEPYNITDEGLVLVIGLAAYEGYVKDDIFYKKNVNDNYPENIKLSKYFKIGLLSYDNILTYDINSGEGRPIMYCKYDGELGPFKEVYYSLTENFK